MMKNLTSLLLSGLCLLSAACKKDNTPTSVVGKWQLTENFLSIGGPGFWRPVTDKKLQEVVEFKADGVYSSNLVPAFNRYQIADSVTLVLYSSVNKLQPRYTYRYKIADQSLVLTPTAPIVCYEGCAAKYRKQGN
jgi:hypothetical protein